MTTWASGDVTLYCGDCLEILPTLEAGSVDAVVTDPPYGIDIMLHPADIHVSTRACAGREYLPVIGNDQEFDPTPLFRFGLCVLWGANHYAHRLSGKGQWLIWDKRCDTQPERNQADCEMAWCSRYAAARIFRHRWDGMIRDSERGVRRDHPTQKPVAVMIWCMERAKVPEGATVLDPFMGSGTTGVACVQTGRKFIGIEIDPGYFEIARQRIARAQAEMVQASFGVVS